MAKIPDYLIIEYDSKTTEESIEVKVVENGISLGMVAGISVGIVAGLLFFCILGILFFLFFIFIKIDKRQGNSNFKVTKQVEYFSGYLSSKMIDTLFRLCFCEIK